MSTPGWGLSGWGDPFAQVGNQPFDQLLTGQCDIYRKTGVTRNSYGNYNQVPTLVEQNVLCRLSGTSGNRAEGSESKDPKEAAIRKWKFFMRPRAYNLGEHHGIVFLGRGFNITNIVERYDAGMGLNHLEVFVDEVMPSTVTPPPV